MKKNSLTLYLLISIILFTSFFTGCSKKSPEIESTISIGLIKSSSVSKDSVEMLIDEINNSGGINGKKILLATQICDDDNDVSAAVNSLVKISNINALIVYTNNTCSEKIALLAQEKRIPALFAGLLPNSTITTLGDYIFNISYDDISQGKVLANLVIDNLSKKNVAILYNSDDLSKDLESNFAQDIKGKNGIITIEESFRTDTQDFTSIIKEMRTKKPDVLFVSDYSGKISLIAKQVRALGLSDLIIIGSDNWSSIINDAGHEMTGGYYLVDYATDSSDPNTQSFITKYKALYNLIPTESDALLFEAANALLDSFKSGETNNSQIRDSLAKSSSTYLSGNISFDNSRNALRGFAVYKLNSQGNEIVPSFYSTINP